MFPSPTAPRQVYEMRCWLAIGVLGLMISPGGSVSAEVSLQDLYGAWRGATAEVDGLEGVEPGDLDVTISPDGGGFRMRWTALEEVDGRAARRTIDVAFEQTGKPGVFAYREEPGSLFARLFASPATGNPLEGETLLWARVEGPQLVVYSLILNPAGGFDLDRYEHARDDDTLNLSHSRRTEDGEIMTIRGRLEPAGG